MNNIIRDVNNSSRLTIGLIIDCLGADYHTDLTAGISDYTKENNINFVCYMAGRLHSLFEWEKSKNLLYNFIDKNVLDGILISVTTVANIVGKEKVEKFIQKYTDIPIVAIGDKLKNRTAVLVDNNSCMEQIVKHMIEKHNYKKIAYVTGPEGCSETEIRFNAYKNVLSRYQIPYKEELVVSGDFSVPSGNNALRILMDERKVDFDAVVCANDNMAFGMLEEMKQKRMMNKIPITGFDDRLFSREIQLTTAVYPTREQGRLAADILIKKINGEEVPEATTFPAEIIIRESCGCSLHEKKNSIKVMGHTNLFESSFELCINKIISEIIDSKLIIEKTNENCIQDCLKPLIDSIIEDLKEHYASRFYIEWDKALNLALIGEFDLSVMRDILSIIRDNILTYIPDNKDLIFIEELFYQAGMMVLSALNKKEAFNKIILKNKINKLDQIEDALTSSLNIEKQFDIMSRELPQLGIKSIYISLFEDPDNPLNNSRLIFAYNHSGRYPVKNGGIVFPTKELLPVSLISHLKPYSFIVENLFHGNFHLGFIIFEYDSHIDNNYQKLRGIINDSLYTVILLDKIRREADNLELQVREQTVDIYRTNAKLEVEIAERKEAEEKLIKSEERFKEMALLLPTVIAETDISMNIKFMNNIGLDLFQLNDYQNSNISFLNFIIPEDRDKVKEYAKKAINGNYSNFNIFRILKNDGNKITFFYKVLPLYVDNVIEGLSWNAIDILPLISSAFMPEESFLQEFNISSREKDIFEYLFKGYKIKDIANNLFITEGTVKDHIGSIYSKIGVKNREEFFGRLKDFQINRFGYHSYISSLFSMLIKE